MGTSFPGRDGAPFDPAVAPLTLAWELTRSCPLRCLHCRAEAQTKRDPGELTTDEGLELIADVAGMGTRVFVVTGGDPLARPDVFDLISAAAGAGMHVGFSPSGTPRLTRANLERAAQAGIGALHLSLDGATKESHDRFRGVRGSFERSMNGVAWAAELDLRLQIGTTVSRQTVRELPAIAEVLPPTVALWSLFFLVPTGRATDGDVLAPDEHEAVLRWLAAAELPFAARTIEAPAYRRLLAEQGRPVGPIVSDGNGFCFVSHVGEVCPSGFLQIPVGNVRDRPVSWWYRNDPLFVALRDRSRLGGKCGCCRYRDICGGSRARAWAMTGDPLAADPTCSLEP